MTRVIIRPFGCRVPGLGLLAPSHPAMRMFLPSLIPAVLLLPRAPPAALMDGEEEDGGLHSLLLQRAVQTCCFTARTCRDPPTAKWLAARAGVAELYHGVDGLPASVGSNWTGWLADMLAAPNEEVVVTSVLKKHRGVSADNPYLQPSPMEYTYELRPTEVAEKVMRTAELIAREWREDLALMEDEAESVWRYRRAITLDDTTEVRETLPAFSVDPMNSRNSPYRGGSYELLVALATRIAAQSALASLAAQPKSWAARELLAEHCASDSVGGEAELLFGGELPRQAADGWIARLLEMPVTLRVGGPDSEPALVDPRGAVEQVLEWRAAVAEDWRRRLKSVPDEVLQIKRAHVSRGSGLT